jgi:transcription elongation GreA/GreB family factor
VEPLRRNTAIDLPQVTIATDDYNRLMSVAMDRHRRSPHLQFLLSEMRRASLSHPDDLPEDMVSTSAKVTYRVDGGRPMAHVLVHPQDLLWPGAELSVLTPLGIALLGLREQTLPDITRIESALAVSIGAGVSWITVILVTVIQRTVRD